MKTAQIAGRRTSSQTALPFTTHENSLTPVAPKTQSAKKVNTDAVATRRETIAWHVSNMSKQVCFFVSDQWFINGCISLLASTPSHSSEALETPQPRHNIAGIVGRRIDSGRRNYVH